MSLDSPRKNKTLIRSVTNLISNSKAWAEINLDAILITLQRIKEISKGIHSDNKNARHDTQVSKQSYFLLYIFTKISIRHLRWHSSADTYQIVNSYVDLSDF